MNVSTPTSSSVLAEVDAVLAAPGFAADNDGYALASEIARKCRRSLDSVKRALSEGEQLGLFTARPHATMITSVTREPVIEYRAIPSS
jgi:hypothetical protein